MTYAVGTEHVGRVVALQPFGAFVELGPAVEGLIYTLDLSFERVKHPQEVVRVGEDIAVKIISMDVPMGRIILHPSLVGDRAKEPQQQVQLHKVVKATVVRVEQKGLVMRILGVTGRCAQGYIPAPAPGAFHGVELRKQFPLGTIMKAKVMGIDKHRAEVKLSVKALEADEERAACQEYRHRLVQQTRLTLGDVLSKQR